MRCPCASRKKENLITNISFEKKVTLVTGAGSGLGLATAKAFAESGAAVVLPDWNEKSVRAAAHQLVAQGHEALVVTCDVSDDGQVEEMVSQTVATFGHLDAAYNNGGVQNVLAEAADSKHAPVASARCCVRTVSKPYLFWALRLVFERKADAPSHCK
jgi:NAD(P)-dependent dehydrogenase (short-subunit alcohol dehydrogenase family)